MTPLGGTQVGVIYLPFWPLLLALLNVFVGSSPVTCRMLLPILEGALFVRGEGQNQR